MAAIAAAAAGALASRRIGNANITQRSSSSSSAPFSRTSRTKITKRSIAHSSSRNDSVLVRVLNEQGAEIKRHGEELNTRVTITCFEKGDVGGSLVLLPRSFEELKKIGVKKYGASFVRVLSEEGAEIDDIRVVRDGDRVNFASQRWRL